MAVRPSQMSYPEFLEAVAALSVYKVRNPYLSLPQQMQQFIDAYFGRGAPGFGILRRKLRKKGSMMS